MSQSLYSNIHSSWNELFQTYDEKIQKIMEKMHTYPSDLIYPPESYIFRVFEMPVEDIQIFLLGQDVYHGKGQANGLAFSVNHDIKIPPSLRNIFQEIQQEFPDRNYQFPHGDLSRWFSHNKIFLCNSALTVFDGKAGIFMKDWEEFTDAVISYVQQKNQNCIFVLWGNFAISKKKYIEDEKRILSCAHPSPLSAHRGFFGSGIFQKIEEKLQKEIDWNII